MINYNDPAVIVVIVLLCTAVAALHVCSCILSEQWRKILAYVNVGIHSVLVIPAIFLTSAEGEALGLDVIVMFYTLSALFYTVTYLVTDVIEKHKLRHRAEREEEDCDL